MCTDDRIIVGTGNVFEDMGCKNPEEKLQKSNMIIELTHLITEIGLTRKEASAILHVDEEILTGILRGKLSLVTVEQLQTWINTIQI